MVETLTCRCGKRYRVKALADGTIRKHCCPYCGVGYANAAPDPIPRYLVLVEDTPLGVYESEGDAIRAAESFCRSIEMAQVNGGYSAPVEVVRSVRRWELDPGTGAMLEVGEKVEQPAA